MNCQTLLLGYCKSSYVVLQKPKHPKIFNFSPSLLAEFYYLYESGNLVTSHHLRTLAISLTDQIAKLLIKKFTEVFNRSLVQHSILNCRDISMAIAADLVRIKLFLQDKPHIVKQIKCLEQIKTQASNMTMGSKIISSKLPIILFPPNPRQNHGEYKLVKCTFPWDMVNRPWKERQLSDDFKLQEKTTNTTKCLRHLAVTGKIHT